MLAFEVNGVWSEMMAMGLEREVEMQQNTELYPKYSRHFYYSLPRAL